MTSLIWKDLVSQIKYLGILLLFYLIFSFGFQIPAEVFIGVGVLMTSLRLGYLEDKNNTLLLLRTLPLKPSTIVFSKYLSILLIAAIFLSLSLGYLLFTGGWELERIAGSLAALTVMLLFAGFYFILFFKLGYSKASTYFRLFSLGVFVLFMVPSLIQRTIAGLKWIESHVPMTWVTVIVAEVGLLGIYLLMGMIATGFLKARELN